MISTLKTRTFLMVAAVLLLATAATPAAAITQIFEVQVNAGENDAEEDSAGVANLTEATLDLGGLYRKVGLRFANITLVKNAPITRAYIEFTTAGQDSANTTFSIEAVAQDNPGVFTTGIFNIATRPVYSQAVDWAMNYAWVTTDEVHQSADITALVQKLVNRSGWVSGNAMAFVISNGEDVFRKAKSWNADPAKAPKLHIEYAVNVVDVRVSSATDDVHQSSLTPYAITNGDNVVLSASYVYSGFRFQNVNIPQGAVINYACLKFVAKNTYAATTGYMRLQGEKRLNPPTFSTVVGNTDSLYKRTSGTPIVPKTTYAQWSNNGAWTAGTEYTSVDIKSIIQEIVGQAGWETSTKSLALNFYYSNLVGAQQRQVWTYNSDPTKAALLHIEYGQAPAGAGTDPPVISLSNSELGRSSFEGSTAASQHFSLMNSGATALNYATTVTYIKGSGWLSLTPSASGTLGAGEEQNFTVSFNTTGLIAGTYDAIVKFTDANAANSPQEVKVSLAILPQGAIQCGDIPLYTQNVASPAVLILLDLSGSMLWEIDIIPENYDFSNAATPDIKTVVQEIVNRDGWAGGNAITFILEHVSGTGRRYARSFDGYSPSAALFHLEYDDGTGVQTIERRVNKSTDDGEAISAIPFSPTSQYHRMCDSGNGYGAAYRFENLSLPKGATVTNAWMQFVPYRSDSDALTVKISAHASDNSPTFSSATSPQLLTTSRPRTAASVSWSIPEWTGVTIETKIDIAKTVIGELVKDTGISWGFGSWANDPTDYYSSTIDYTKIQVGCNAHTAEHQVKLQAAVAGLGTYSSTPFSPSLIAGRKYFDKEKAEWDPVANAEAGTRFQDASCQPKFLIEVTDGVGNVDSTKENVIERANLLLDKGVTPIGIGFGLAEDETEQLYAFAETANTRGKASSADGIYPMHQEVAGKGIPYMTKNKDELMNAFRTIMNSVKGAVFYGSAPAATTSTDLGDLVVLSSFNAGNWTGEVEAITKNSDGSWNTSAWKASENFPVTRNVWTVDAGNNLIAYTGSTLAGDNYLCKNLGDIIHSTPAVVGEPPYFYTFDGYSGFKRAHSVTSPRERMIYVGSNDGLLHAFSLEEGTEKWAFLPKSLQAKLNQAANGASYNPCSTSYCHQYLLDGSPQVADVYRELRGGLQIVAHDAGGRAAGGRDGLHRARHHLRERVQPRDQPRPIPLGVHGRRPRGELGGGGDRAGAQRGGRQRAVLGRLPELGVFRERQHPVPQGGLPLRSGGRHRHRSVERRYDHDQQDQADPGGREPEFHRPERRGPRAGRHRAGPDQRSVRHGRGVHLQRIERSDRDVERLQVQLRQRRADRLERRQRHRQRHVHRLDRFAEEQRARRAGDREFCHVRPRGGLHLRRRPLRDDVPGGQHRQGSDPLGVQALPVQPVPVGARRAPGPQPAEHRLQRQQRRALGLLRDRTVRDRGRQGQHRAAVLPGVAGLDRAARDPLRDLQPGPARGALRQHDHQRHLPARAHHQRQQLVQHLLVPEALRRAGRVGRAGRHRRQRAGLHQAPGRGRRRLLHDLHPGFGPLHRQRGHLRLRARLQDGAAADPAGLRPERRQEVHGRGQDRGQRAGGRSGRDLRRPWPGLRAGALQGHAFHHHLDPAVPAVGAGRQRQRHRSERAAREPSAEEDPAGIVEARVDHV